MSKDYYSTLGVSKGVSQEEIKKAYRVLAHQHHPDKKGGNEAKFKEINEAYQVLGNPEKRQKYDQYGTADFGPSGFNWQDFAQSQGFGGGGFSGGQGVEFDMGDIGDLFGDLFGFGGSRRRGRSRRPKRGNDIEADVEVEFNEAVFGAEKIIRLNKTVTCGHCRGNGAEPGSKIITCSQCGGNGQVQQAQRTILGVISTVTTCPACGGEGKTYEQPCSHCRGQGIAQETKELKIKIPAGIDDGQQIRLSGQGEAGLRGAPGGDLYLLVHVKPSQVFKREGYDLQTVRTISFSLATLGGKIAVKTLAAEVSLKIPTGTQTGKVFRLHGHGVPKLRGSGHGDLLVTVEIQTPERLTKKQKRLLQEFAAEEGEVL